MHWYVGCGLSEGFFSEAEDRMQSLIDDYKEIFMQTIEGEAGSDDYSNMS